MNFKRFRLIAGILAVALASGLTGHALASFTNSITGPVIGTTTVTASSLSITATSMNWSTNTFSITLSNGGTSDAIGTCTATFTSGATALGSGSSPYHVIAGTPLTITITPTATVSSATSINTVC